MKPARTINYVARETGLSAHTIRVWEKRYGAVKPARAANKRRLYREQDVARLRLLRQATDAGHRIGQIATASQIELQKLLGESWHASPSAGDGTEEVRALLDAAGRAITEMNTLRFQDVLDRAAIALGSPAVLTKFIAPLARDMGALWRKGDVRIAQEHFATNLLKVFLSIFGRSFAPNETSPHLLIATPSGQHHELGAMLAGAAARTAGWIATYLGPSLPVEELIHADQAIHPAAVGLSIVFPPDDAALQAELRTLDRCLPRERPILLGGESAPAYEKTFRRHQVFVVPELDLIFPVLTLLRAGAAKRRSKSS